jgi:ribosomal protein S1
MSSTAGRAYQVGDVVTASVEQVYPFGVFLRLPDGTPGYVRWRDVTRGGHWDPSKVVAVGQEVEATVAALATAGRVMELSLRSSRAKG